MSNIAIDEAGTSVLAQKLDGTIHWLKSRERAIALSAVIFQVVVLVAMIASKASVLMFGDTILLRVIPVDPRDLFRGDYVILGYDFSGGRPGSLSASQWEVGQTVYISLAEDPDGKHWHSLGIHAQRPTEGKFLRGKVNNLRRIECGIESYFVQEGKGRQYEDAVRQRRLSAEISVDREGQAVLRGLRIE
jgi:uncharacterized membrane-anchored protein